MRWWIHCLAAFGLILRGEAGELHRLELSAPDAAGWPRLSISTPSNTVVRLESSSDLIHWAELGRGHDGLEWFPDPGAFAGSARYYRTISVARTPADDWKNQVRLPGDGLVSPPPGYGEWGSRWVKFAILLDAPDRVYFQDSAKYLFHFDFARARLPGFGGLSRPEFDAVSLHRSGQRVVLGAVVVAPTDRLQEMGIQFVGMDPYPSSEVAAWFTLVRECVVRSAEAEVLYFPTFEQEAAAMKDRAWLEGQGIRVSSPARWVMADECYAAGWALGRLVAVAAADLEAAYRGGLLGPRDILLLDAVPAEVPPVAGIITRTPATPNSHVALLAQSFGIPFVYFAGAEDQAHLEAWHGQEVVLRATETFNGARAKVVSLEGQLTPEMREALLTLQTPSPLNLPPKTAFGQISLDTAGLRPADAKYVGGKAAHFGLLRRAIPDACPSPSLAFTFDLWDAYLDQTVPGGSSLRVTIAERLAGFSWPPNMAQLSTALEEVRNLITRTADFTAAQKSAILAILQAAGFGGDRNIRFRSSTNVEDNDQFNGAGLYDSYSGCLADDLDGDDLGPSVCDGTEVNERGVFRALRKVYASFYNDNAYLERLRHGVDEARVGMGVLVHPSTPDAFELANGVATVRVNKGTQPNDRAFRASLVTQAGAVSVANPGVTARPEEVVATSWSGGVPYLTMNRASSLVPLGDHVLEWEQEYRSLATWLDAAARAYEAEFPARRILVLDFEYKKVAPEGRLQVKQIREVPQLADASVAPWLLNETNRYAVLQGEYGDVFACYRLKSWWQFTAVNRRLSDPDLAGMIYDSLEADCLEGDRLVHRAGRLPDLPGFQHARSGEQWLDRWVWGTGEDQRTFQLETWLPTSASVLEGPLAFLSDGQVWLTETYATPQPTLSYLGPTNTWQDTVVLAPVASVGPLSLPQTRVMSSRGVTITTRFFWPPPPVGVVAGYTAPLQAWIETRIEGLAAQPIILHGDLSQTYHAGHHNFFEEFIFDPHLEEGIDPAILAQLEALNIRALVATYGYPPNSPWMLLGMDRKLRSFE